MNRHGNPSWSNLTRQLIQAAVAEDLDEHGDITSALLETGQEPVTARLVARASGVICGLTLAPEICAAFTSQLESPLTFAAASSAAQSIEDGTAITTSQTVATLTGPRAAVLATERTLLNFLCRMSGVATLTRRYVELAASVSPTVKILDTRKTLPGWRELDKYAVRCGGGHNYRAGLYDAVLIKDNHLAGIPVKRLAARLFDMLNLAAEQRPLPAFVEVEVDTLEQLAEVFSVVGVDIVLLDNFGAPEMKAAVELRDAMGLRSKIELEASGGVGLDTIQSIAGTGVDRISIGALTHSAPALDLSLEL